MKKNLLSALAICSMLISTNTLSATINKKTGDFLNLFYSSNDVESHCTVNIKVTRNNKILMNEKEKCLNFFAVNYDNKKNDGTDFSFVIATDKIDGLTKNGMLDAKVKEISVTTFTSEDNENVIQVPKIITHNISTKFSLKSGVPFVSELPGRLTIEFTYFNNNK